MAEGLKRFGDGGGDSVVEGEAGEAGRGLGERADVVSGGDARGGNGGDGVAAAVDQVDEQLEGDLILEVAAGDGDGEDGLAVAEDKGGREGDARAFAGLDGVGVVGFDAEALKARTEPEAGLAGEGTGPAAGRGGDDVAPAVGDEASRGVVGVVELARLEGLGGTEFGGGVVGVDQSAALAGVVGVEEGREGDFGEEGVGVEGVAVGEGEFEGFDDQVDVGGRVGVVEGVVLEDQEGLEEGGALGPGTAFEDGVAVVVEGDGFFDAGQVGGEVVAAEEAALGAGPSVDLVGDGTAVEVVGGAAEAEDAVGGGGFGLDQGAEGLGQLGVPGEGVAVEEV